MDFTYDNLKAKLELPDGKRFLERMLTIYNEKYAGKPIVVPSYSYYKLIYQTGNRSLYQTEYLQRRERLAVLQILALSDDRYLEDLENVLCAICDSYTWIWPAHSLINKEQGKFDYTVVDLYSATTALELAEVYAVYENKLSTDIKDRIKSCIKTKVIDCFESRSFWWETKFGTNWTGVCGGSVGAVYLYLFPERFDAVKDRLNELCEDYFRGIHDDGVCEEGPSYFVYGFGFLCVYGSVYKQIFNDLPAPFKSEKIQKMLSYYNRSILGGKFIQLGDESSANVVNFSATELYIKKVFPEFMLPDYNFALSAGIDNRETHSVRILDSVGRYDGEKRRDIKSANFSVYYDKAQLFLFSNENYAFSVKGGHNKEMHNHNDIGAFSVIRNGEKLISDYGSGEYTWEYFNDPVQRYGEKIFVCGSLSHSVPIIDGGYQLFGADHRADFISATENSVAFNIAKAYGIFDETLIAEYVCEKTAVKVNYSFSGKNRQITFRFLSDVEPKVCGDKVYLNDMVLSCEVARPIEVKKHTFRTPKGEGSAYTIDFPFEKSEKLNVSFSLSLDAVK